MSHQNGSLTEFQKLRQNHINLRIREHHVVVDAGQLLDLKGNRYIRIYEGAEFVRNDSIHHLDGADLDDPVLFRAKASGLDIEYHEGVRKCLVFRIIHQQLQVVDKIPLHPIEDLEGVPLVQSVVGIREGLHASVVCDGDGRHTPLFCTLYDILYLRNAVHIAHLRMTVKLDPFFQASVHPFSGEVL